MAVKYKPQERNGVVIENVIKYLCGEGGILTGPTALEYHTGDSPFADFDEEIYFDTTNKSKLLKLEKKGLKIEKGPWFDGLKKVADVMYIHVNGCDIILFPYQKEMSHIEEDGLKITDINSTIKHFEIYGGKKSDLAIRKLRAI